MIVKNFFKAWGGLDRGSIRDSEVCRRAKAPTGEGSSWGFAGGAINLLALAFLQVAHLTVLKLYDFVYRKLCQIHFD